MVMCCPSDPDGENLAEPEPKSHPHGKQMSAIPLGLTSMLWSPRSRMGQDACRVLLAFDLNRSSSEHEVVQLLRGLLVRGCPSLCRAI